MLGNAPRHRKLIYVLCSVLLLAQVTGAHVHLCFDGQEPPVQLHMPGASESHEASEFSQPHSDKEIALNKSSSAHAKHFQFDLQPAIQGTFVVDLKQAAGPIAAPGFDQPPPYAAPREFLPPPRGPPLRT